MKTTKILKKKFKRFLSFLTFGLIGAVVLAACSQAAQANATTSEKGDATNHPNATAEDLKLTNALLQKQSFKQYLSSFPISLEEAFQIPPNTLESSKLARSVANPEFQYVFEEFFKENKTVIGNLADSSNEASGMYQTIGVSTDDQTKKSIYGYLAALLQNLGETKNTVKSLTDKIKSQLGDLVNQLNDLKLKIDVGNKSTGTPATANYLVQQAAVLAAAQKLVNDPSTSNWTALKTSVESLKSLVTPVLNDLTKVTTSINQLKTDFEELSKKVGATSAEEISKNTELNNLLNKFSELFMSQRMSASGGNMINLPFNSQASLFTSKSASKLLQELDNEVDFASFFTKIQANDVTTINLLASHYQDSVSGDITSLQNDKSKNLLIVFKDSQGMEFLSNLKILKTTLNSYKVLLSGETNSQSISYALTQAQEALKSNDTADLTNKENAETALTNLVKNLADFKTQFASLQGDLDTFVISLEKLETQAEAIINEVSKAKNFGELLNFVSQSIALKLAVLEINKLVPLLNADNVSRPVDSNNLGQKIENLRGQDTLRQLKSQSEQLVKFIKKIPDNKNTELKRALEKVANETDSDGVKNRTGALDQLLYGAPNWNETSTLTYGLNGYKGQDAVNSSATPTNLKDFLSNFGTSNQKGLTALGRLQKLINENYTLEANPESFAILNKIIEAIK